VSGELLEAILDRIRAMPGESLIVIDPDGLVRSVAVLDVLAAGGTRVVSWDDPIEARLAWAQSATLDRLVIVDREFGAETLPADVISVATRRATVLAREVFAPLDRALINLLEWGDRSSAYALAISLSGAPLDGTQTAARLLRHLYRLDADVMRQPESLLEGLLRLHRVPRAAPMSAELARWFAAQVGDLLPGLATREALRDRSLFVGWLQTQWFAAATREDQADLRDLLLADGPRQLLDNYFEDGLLVRAEAAAATVSLPFGVSLDAHAEAALRVKAGVAAVNEILSGNEVGHDQWRAIAEQWADVLVAACTAPGEQDLTTLLEPIRSDLNRQFVSWLPSHYPELATLPGLTVPAMVHRSARVMDASRHGNKAALVVVDGLSLALWKTILTVIRSPGWNLAESTTFAWLPTITSISRQAIFAGRVPATFPASIGTTEREAAEWLEYWATNAKLAAHDVGYVKAHLRNDVEGSLPTFLPLASQLGRTILGIVVEDVDHELHGERLGEAAFHAAIQRWAREGQLKSLIDVLLGDGYVVYLTSDHGFVPATTVGVSQAGATAHAHGRFERFSDQLLADQADAKSKLEGRMPWTNFGLPPDYLVTFAPLFGALKPKGDRLLTHGGPTLEEVIVPWVVISR
jgi:hypothetical protein